MKNRPETYIPYQRDYQKEYRRIKRAEWFKNNGPCVKCGSWERLELDHINKADKTTHRIFGWGKVRFDAEVAKCQVLCFKCHRAKSGFERRKNG